jgi:hypothetical protein
LRHIVTVPAIAWLSHGVESWRLIAEWFAGRLY